MVDDVQERKQLEAAIALLGPLEQVIARRAAMLREDDVSPPDRRS